MQIDPEINELIKKYFTFSRREYKATLALFLLTLTVWFYADVRNYFFPITFNNSLIEQKAKELDALQSTMDTVENAIQGKFNKTDSNNQLTASTKDPVYFNFNPNKCNEEDFIKLGFNEKQIHIIYNYLLKVGEIKSKADFKKIYSISETQFNALAPYIQLPETRPKKEFEKENKFQKNTQTLIVEINSADSVELDKLPGIGMGYARRIIKYRTSLGGFITLSQLMEVYGFRQTLLDTITPFLTFDLTKITKLNINTSTADELKKHPYLRWKIANAIVNYRLQHGIFKTIEELKNVVLVNDEIFLKIKSYIAID